eukprot:8123-Heterococcus_DN1.PRE.3
MPTTDRSQSHYKACCITKSENKALTLLALVFQRGQKSVKALVQIFLVMSSCISMRCLLKAAAFRSDSFRSITITSRSDAAPVLLL